MNFREIAAVALDEADWQDGEDFDEAVFAEDAVGRQQNKRTNAALEFDLQLHDRRFHKGHYDGKTECKYREKMAAAMGKAGLNAGDVQGLGTAGAAGGEEGTASGQPQEPSEAERKFLEIKAKFEQEGQTAISPEEFVKARNEYLLAELGEAEAECVKRLEEAAKSDGPQGERAEAAAERILNDERSTTAQKEGAQAILDARKEWKVNGKTYVDLSGMGFWEGLKEAFKAGYAGKDIVTDWDKMSGRWDAITASDPKFKEENGLLQEGVKDALADLGFGEDFEKAEKIEGLSREQWQEIGYLKYQYDQAESAKDKHAAWRKLKDYLKEQGLEKPQEWKQPEVDAQEKEWDSIVDGQPNEVDSGSGATMTPVEKAYHDEVAAINARRGEMDGTGLSAEDAEKEIAKAKAKAKEAGFDPDEELSAIYGRGLEDLDIAKRKQLLSPTPAKANATQLQLAQDAQTYANNIDSYMQYVAGNKKNFSANVVDHTVNGNDIEVTLKIGNGVNPKEIEGMKTKLETLLNVNGITMRHVGPGADEMTISIPHKDQDFHSLRDSFEDPVAWDNFKKAGVPITLGRKMNKENSVIDLASDDGSPHMFIAGTTKSGKSVTGRNILAGWLMKDSSVCRPYVIDPKGEFAKMANGQKGVGYAGGNENVLKALKWLNKEMDRRNKIITGSGYDNIAKYNAAHKNNPMPYMPVLFDEMANAFSGAEGEEAKKEFSALIAKCRSSGINIVGLSQGAIEQDIMKNFGHRLAYKVTNATQSQQILGKGHHEAVGAKMRGDGFYSPESGSEPVRIQAPNINDGDIQAILAWRNGRGKPAAKPTSPAPSPTAKSTAGGSEGGSDGGAGDGGAKNPSAPASAAAPSSPTPSPTPTAPVATPPSPTPSPTPSPEPAPTATAPSPSPSPKAAPAPSDGGTAKPAASAGGGTASADPHAMYEDQVAKNGQTVTATKDIADALKSRHPDWEIEEKNGLWWVRKPKAAAPAAPAATQTVPSGATVTNLSQSQVKRAEALTQAQEAGVKAFQAAQPAVNAAQKAKLDGLLGSDSGFAEEG